MTALRIGVKKQTLRLRIYMKKRHLPACADAWAASSSNKTSRNEIKAITNVDHSCGGATRKLPASSNSKTPSDDCESWSSTSNSTAPKSNIVPISGGNESLDTPYPTHPPIPIKFTNNNLTN